jgi:hypothetical protein
VDGVGVQFEGGAHRYVFLNVFSHPWKVEFRFYTNTGKHFWSTDAGEFENLGRLDGPGSKMVKGNRKNIIWEGVKYPALRTTSFLAWTV